MSLPAHIRKPLGGEGRGQGDPRPKRRLPDAASVQPPAVVQEYPSFVQAAYRARKAAEVCA